MSGLLSPLTEGWVGLIQNYPIKVGILLIVGFVLGKFFSWKKRRSQKR